MTTELDLARDAAAILARKGRTYLGYITAELEPFSAQQRPDISFTPESGPNAGDAFFVELQLYHGKAMSGGALDRAIAHREFASDSAEFEFGGYAVATDAIPDAATAADFEKAGIKVLPGVASADRLAALVAEWASA